MMGPTLGWENSTNMEDLLDTNRVNRVMRCLASPDKKINNVAWDQFSGVVRKRKKEADITNDDLQQFLNTTPAQGEHRQGDVRSLWSTVRKSIQRQAEKICNSALTDWQKLDAS